MKIWTLPALVLAALLPQQAAANHGPATSAGGITVDSAEPLPAGETAFILREHYTSYENLTRAEIAARADSAGEFDYLRESFITTLGTAYGVTDDFDLAASLGWYSGRGFVNAEGDQDNIDSVAEEVAVGNPSGLTDLTVRGKFRFASFENNTFALLGGVVAPTGDRRERLSNGNTLDPSSQPGTGRFGFQGGLAFTHAFTGALKLDTSSLYTHRLERDDLRIGDRLDTGVAVSSRLTDAHDGAGISFFGELNHIWLGKDKSDEGLNQNSGGTSLFLTGGLRLDLGEHLTLTVAPSVPLYQGSNGEQVEVAYKLTGLLMIRL